MTRILVTLLTAVAALNGGLAGLAMAEDLTYCQQAQVLYDDGDYSGAIAKINQCISEGSLSEQTRACAVFNRGRCYLSMSQPDKGFGDLHSAISRDPSLGETQGVAACTDLPAEEAAALLEALVDD